MPSVCFYFQVHQPRRIKRYRVFDIGADSAYFNDEGQSNLNNRSVLEKVARKCYIPANTLMLKLLKQHPSFRVSYSLSGIGMEQMNEYTPEVMDSFRHLVDTGRVEILGETYYHSLAFLYSVPEFRKQVLMHARMVYNEFGYTPRVFRNTELIYNNALGAEVERMGYTAVLAEGSEHVLGWRSPNFVYRPVGAKRIKLLLKNYKLSDDIAFRFSERSWREWPLTAPKFAQWISSHNGNGEVINLFMDYETFGEHQWGDTGIFQFLEALPQEVLQHPDADFVTPSEAAARYPARDRIDMPYFVSWADVERDLSAWKSNVMQEEALRTLYALEGRVRAAKNKQLTEAWRRLQTSDHFYYMCTKWFADGDVHTYFNPYESPYDASISFMNALCDLQLRVEACEQKKSNAKMAQPLLT